MGPPQSVMKLLSTVTRAARKAAYLSLRFAFRRLPIAYRYRIKAAVYGLLDSWRTASTTLPSDEIASPSGLASGAALIGNRPAGSPLRVLLQADSFTQGGMEQVVIDLAESLDPIHFSVALLVLGEAGAAAATARQRGIRVLTLPDSDRQRAYRQLLLDEQIHLVNAHYSLFGASLACGLGIPFVQTVHNTYVWLTPQQCAAHKANDRFTSAYLCVSSAVARYSEAKLGLASAKIMVVPNGIDLARARPSHRGKYRAALRERFGFAADDVLFLNAATIQPPKAQIALVLAFAQVISQHPKSRLLLAGRVVDSAYEARLRKVIRQTDLQSAVVLAGHHAEVAPFYDAADAFVLPSLWEGWSMALTEAAACGLPLIATAVGGAAELLGEVGGELVAPPFDSITDLDLSSIGRYLNRENPAFVARLADAMARVAASAD